MAKRLIQVLLVVCTLWVSWLLMMLIHEAGHMLGALCTGGHVQRVIWHPLALSRTDVQPNPNPLVEIWSGPVFGSLLPVLIASSLSFCRVRMAYLAWAVAGFCLIANGTYLGIGAFDLVGDARDLVVRGMSRWVLVAFGILTVSTGFYIWHCISGRRDISTESSPTFRHDAYIMFALAIGLTLAGLFIGESQ